MQPTRIEHRRRGKNSRLRHASSNLVAFLNAQATRLLATSTPRTFTTGISPSLACTAHGFTTGKGPVVLATAGTLPAGFTAGTLYWPIVVDANTVRLALTRQDAAAGTAVTFSSAGSGTHSVAWASTRASLHAWLRRSVKSQQISNLADIDVNTP